MQIDLVPGLPPSGGYENIVTAMDVFSRYLFAHPTSNQDAKTIAKVIINIILERFHASIKPALKIEIGERRSLWHIYDSIALLNYNTSYHTSIGCEPSRVSWTHALQCLRFKMCIHPQYIPSPGSQIAQDVLEQTEIIFQDFRENAMQAYIKYKAYFDKKSQCLKF